MRKWTTMIVLLCLVSIGTMFAQTRTITGKVLSTEDGEPVAGASIRIEGTTIGTTTNFDGEFTLGVPANTKTLIISYIGMKTAQVPVQDRMNVSLDPDTQTLDEVIVVAYGTSTKKSFTGSASVVGSEQLDKRILTTVTSALEGNVSGVQMTSALGQPGSSPDVRIRGFGSVNASNKPLYIVDGSVYNGEIADLNPSDIESMTVLKDAASTSLYGSSAGNGVIVITTKKGTNNTSGSAGVTLNITQGWSSQAYKDIDRVNVWEYYPLQWEMLKNAYVTSGETAEKAAQLASEKIVSTLKYNPFSGIADGEVVGTDGRLNPNATTLKWGDDLDWEDAAFGNGYRQEYNLSYNSKGEKSDTYSSIGYLNDKGYMLKTDYERYSGRVNHNIYPTKWFKAGVNLAYSRTLSNYSTSNSDNSSAYSNLARFVRTMAPIYPVHKHDLTTGAYLDKDGNPTINPKEYVYDYEGARLSNNGRDAIAETEFNMRNNTRTNIVGRSYITITPIEGLTATVDYAFDNTDRRQKVYENPYVGDGTAGPGRLNILSSRIFSETFKQLIAYNKTFNRHRLDLLVGHESYEWMYEYLYSMKTQQTVPGVYDFVNFVNISSATSYTRTYNKEGYLARLNYDYRDKYYASLSYRRDGSSRFHKDYRWGDFWSFGASWRISEEDFMEGYGWINNLKLRASYGETGVDGILDADGVQMYYPYQSLYKLGIDNALESGVYFSVLSNSSLKWETQVLTDVALEFGLFNRINGVVEFFNKTSSDLIFDTPLATSNGVPSVIQNIGKSRNQGIEVELDIEIFRNKDWRINFGGNASWIKNKITRLPDDSRETGIVTGSKKYVEGHSRYEFWLRQWYGVNPANGDGLYYLDTETYNESSGNWATVQKTLVEIDGKQLTNSYSYAKWDLSGDAAPKMNGGFNFRLGYKSFDLGAVFSYQLGGKLLDNAVYGNAMSTSEYGFAMHEDVKKAWKQPGDITDVPRLDKSSTHATNIGQSYSTRWLINSNYLNMRSLTLSYSLPRKVLQPILLSNARITLSGENLFMIKPRRGINPMANYTGITYNEYMPARVFTIGLNLSF